MENDKNLQVIKSIASGSFGKVYRAWKRDIGELVAVKLERHNASCSVIGYEAKLLKTFSGNVGFPKFYSYEKRKERKYVVMECLGPSLDWLHFKNLVFSLKTTILIAEQVLTRIHLMHSKGFINRDIKPDNLVVGVGKKYKTIYMIDFGLSKRFWDERSKRHIRQKSGRSLVGTARYASVNSHLGNELSRRDDLESLMYVLAYFVKGQLPWQNIQGNKEYRYQRIGEVKQEYPPEKLFRSQPQEFVQIFLYIQSLGFEEVPDYLFIRKLFLTMLAGINATIDFDYDWITKPAQLQSEPPEQLEEEEPEEDEAPFDDNDPTDGVYINHQYEEPEPVEVEPQSPQKSYQSSINFDWALTNTMAANMQGSSNQLDKSSYNSNDTEEHIYPVVNEAIVSLFSTRPKQMEREVNKEEAKVADEPDNCIMF